MSFKRQEIREILGDAYTDDIASKLAALHRTVVDPLMDQLDTAKQEAAKYKADADRLPAVQNELDALKDGEDWKGKYEKEHQSFEDYKTKLARDAEVERIKAAHTKLLTDEKISEKAVKAILEATDYTGMKLDEAGALDAKSAESLKKEITERWAGFKTTTRQRGERVDNPPPGSDNDGGNEAVRKMAAAWHEQRFGAPAQPSK